MTTSTVPMTIFLVLIAVLRCGRLTCIRLPKAGSKPDKSCSLTPLYFSSKNRPNQFYARDFLASELVLLELGNKSRNLTLHRAARTRLLAACRMKSFRSIWFGALKDEAHSAEGWLRLGPRGVPAGLLTSRRYL